MGCACGKEVLDINGKKFVVRQRLGEGGFSYVDLLEDTCNHKLYAVKRITIHSKDDEMKALKEAESYRRVSHPNVIKCIDCVVKDDERTVNDDQMGEVLIVLPYYGLLLKSEVRSLRTEFKMAPFPFNFNLNPPNKVPNVEEFRIQRKPIYFYVGTLFRGFKLKGTNLIFGGTLQDEIDRRSITKRHFSERNILEMFKQICDGVHAIHNSKPEPLAHRDLKPGNVLLSDNHNPILMDLGSVGSARIKIHTSSEAKTLEDYAAQHCSMLFRAPELFHVETHTTIDERIDVWSLGCLLYAMCFFKSPFEAAHERGDSVALAVGSGTVNIPESSSQYSNGIRELILAMLIVNSAERPFLEVIMQKIDSLIRSLDGTL